MVGYGISKSQLVSRRGIPICHGRRAPVLYLGLSYRLVPDHQDRYLMVNSSVSALAANEDLSGELLHYDYEREKADGYPEAHLQICASSEHWDAVGERVARGSRSRPLSKLHLPVGPRRFRPSLEDVVEFLITEGIAEGHDGWKAVLAASRREFEEKQLRAAIRRAPEVAIAALYDHDLMDR